jgi:sortase A
VLSAHRDTQFAALREIGRGDDVVVETADGRRGVYRVERTAVVDHRDTRALERTESPMLTLVTCYPFDAITAGGPLRFVVRARRTS